MERNIRLTTGLTLFAYAACHFASHATGLFRLDIMDAVGRNLLLAPWQGWTGRVALFGSLLVHGGLGLRALYRRRHLRIPAIDAWQLGLGLLIPLLLIPHVTNVRLGADFYGLDDSYYRILYQYWISSPASGLVRQFTLLFAVWVHGCVGIHFWLRRHVWYNEWRLTLFSVAMGLPFLAVLGLVNAGWDTAMHAALQPGFADAHGPPQVGTAKAANLSSLQGLWEGLQLTYAALVALILLSRLARNRRARRTAFSITYPDGRVARVPCGFSVLEASRWKRVPHASICGGRGRCSTCRIWITRGLDGLPPPSPGELETLRRVKAPVSVRLACQLRPSHDVSVVPLLSASATLHGMGITLNEGRELQVTALFTDLRDSTRLATGRLPFDALFIIDCYVQRVTGIVQAHGGHVTSVAGDGIMSVFGAGTVGAAAGAAGALRAALAIWESLDQLSGELHAEIGLPFAFGMGLHSGVSAVGSIMMFGRPSLQFLGDTGNVTARLDALTKEMGCTLIISARVFDVAGREAPWGVRHAKISIRGRDEPLLAVVLLERLEEARLLAGRETLDALD